MFTFRSAIKPNRMNLLKHLQFTLNSIFDLYINHGKKYYGFSLLFAIVGTISCFIVSLLLVFLIGSITDAPARESLFGLSMMEHATEHYQEVFSLMIGLTMGIYALCIRHSSEDPGEKITLGSSFRRIGADTWLFFALAAIGGGLFIYFVDDQLRNARGSGSPLENLISYSGIWDYWFLDIFSYVKVLLPFVLSFFIIRGQLKKSGIYTSKTNRRATFWSALILGFVINTLSVTFIAMVSRLFMTPLARFFEFSMVLPIVLTFCLYIFILSRFLPGLGGALVYPMLYEPERSISESSNLDEL